MFAENMQEFLRCGGYHAYLLNTFQNFPFSLQCPLLPWAFLLTLGVGWSLRHPSGSSLALQEHLGLLCGRNRELLGSVR